MSKLNIRSGSYVSRVFILKPGLIEKIKTVPNIHTSNEIIFFRVRIDKKKTLM
jgi:hypothetical protein